MLYVMLYVIRGQYYYDCSQGHVRLSSAFKHQTHLFLLQNHNVLLLALKNHQYRDHMRN